MQVYSHVGAPTHPRHHAPPNDGQKGKEGHFPLSWKELFPSQVKWPWDFHSSGLRTSSLPTSPNWFTQIRNASMQQDLPPDYSQLSIPRSATSLQSSNHGEIDDISTTYINVMTSQRNTNDMSSLNVNDLEACNSYLSDQEEVEPPTYESLFPENQSEISIANEINR